MNTFIQKRNTRLELKEFNVSFMEGLWGNKPWSTGRKVKVVQCNSSSQALIIRLDDFSSGLYTYKVIVNSSLVSNGKLNIIK